MTAQTITTIDFESPEFISNPYPAYEYMRSLNGPYWQPHSRSDIEVPGMWLFSKYDDVVQLLKDSSSISKNLEKVRPGRQLSAFDHIMLNQDPPNHTRLRNLVNKVFTPKQIKLLNPRIEAVVDKLITDMQSKPNPDFATDFANLLPMMVIADFMGVPYEDHQMFYSWALNILCGYDIGVKSTDNFVSYKQSLQEMDEYFAILIEKYRKNPSDTLIDSLIAAHDNEDKLSSIELVSMCMLLIIAGHETTANMLSSGMNIFLNHPEQFDLLKKHPEYMESAIEETLRFDSPVQRGTFRITTKECEFGGKKFHEGEQIVAVLGAANRDPAYFEEPNRFDITRNPNRHLSFGLGIHFCIGAFLARNEAFISFTRIIERMPNIKLSTSPPIWNKKPLFRGLQSLPVTIY